MTFFLSLNTDFYTLMMYSRSLQVFTDCNGRVFCMKPAPPKDPSYEDEVLKEMNKYLAGDLYKEIMAAFPPPPETSPEIKTHSSTAQRDPKNSPCISVGYTHGNGSKVA